MSPWVIASALCALILFVLLKRRALAVPAHAPGGSGVVRGDRPAAGSGAHAPLGWQTAVVGDLTAAEELLDELEFAGREEREVIALGNSTFVVRWR